MPILRRQIQASSDDCHYRVTGDLFTLTQTNCFIGRVSANNKQAGCGLRYTNITIPQGATITRAYITFHCNLDRTGTTCNARIKGQDIDDAPTFTTKEEFLARDWTTAVIDWDDVPACYNNHRYHTPDIKTVIQEIVDRPGWQSGNAMVLCPNDFDDRSTANQAYRRFWSYDGNQYSTPQLTIIYEPPAEPPGPHILLDARYSMETPQANRACVIGRDSDGNPVYGTDLDQDEIDLVGEKLDFDQHLSIPTEANADSVAAAILDKLRLSGSRGFIVIPANCGVELWDPIRLTDTPCAQAAATYRILAIRLVYNARAGQFHHKLSLGGL